ncbi:hypothetical protein NW868_09380 [Synechococcus sp. R60.2]
MASHYPLTTIQGKGRDKRRGHDPYRDPFGAVRDRFQALRQEWMFLLEQKRLGLWEHDSSQ